VVGDRTAALEHPLQRSHVIDVLGRIIAHDETTRGARPVKK
jgi:hypothetical protein